MSWTYNNCIKGKVLKKPLPIIQLTWSRPLLLLDWILSTAVLRLYTCYYNGYEYNHKIILISTKVIHSAAVSRGNTWCCSLMKIKACSILLYSVSRKYTIASNTYTKTCQNDVPPSWQSSFIQMWWLPLPIVVPKLLPSMETAH